MKSDEDIRTDVESELQWDPALDANDIVPTVKDGAVTLTGFVKSFNEKWEAEDVAKRVAGVLGVANDLDVRLPSIGQRPDPDIARDAVTTLLYELPDLVDIRVVVKDGLVRLEGEVETHRQSRHVTRAVRRVRGIKGVINTIKVRSPVSPEDIHQTIAEALKRNALLEAANIVVEANGDEVVLKGTVRSWAERKEADEAAWRAPGVLKVDNRITIAS
ncbi:putative osmotically inducible protein Y domain protein (plasmid) [Sinorhizobium fredii NGR234]|uniref:Osmotically inducible protein Y domain protein n=1 Tax=Sinorhizobium fredii (strain NBRC 101917 / NGR234) TaxID=394 RepID=C3KMW6_SINFN|nr:BON domain-containing protein [Sinorhizobium fredii]ACP21539.1 putative osmotically inducible protein Y domain protein [Sinorhizobium fredii NGR234]